MTEAAPFVHPYIPNSAPATREAMLRAVGASSTEELLEAIPEKLRLRRSLDVPAAFRSEFELDRHLQKVLAKNEPASDAPSFLGSGCYPHYVPAICDEINTRGEFLTAYAGETYEDVSGQLGMHRHTLRTRLALISELTGRSLVEPDDRFELWLAVEMRDLTEAGE